MYKWTRGVHLGRRLTNGMLILTNLNLGMTSGLTYSSLKKILGLDMSCCLEEKWSLRPKIAIFFLPNKEKSFPMESLGTKKIF